MYNVYIVSFRHGSTELPLVKSLFWQYISADYVAPFMDFSKRVVVGLSGGIDSAVTLYLLKKAGYDCVGVQMRYWAEQVCSLPEENNRYTRLMHNKCCSDESMLISRQICDFLQVPFYAHDVQETFYENIVNPYIEQYNEGLTPNPCTHCNKTIKFGALMDFADSIGAAYVATGHYARISRIGDSWHIAEAVDDNKDQSYFLYALSQKQLSRMLLPLGDIPKPAVRHLAESAGLTMFKKTYKESQGLCFFPERAPNAFLDRHSSEVMRTPGPLLDHTGAQIGMHRGLAYYTVGQRKGIDIGGLPEPYFVIERRVGENTVVVGPKAYLYTTDARIDRLSLTAQNLPEGREVTVEARIRYRMPRSRARLTADGKGGGTLRFQEPVFAITPGQIAVLYDGPHVLGGARIIPHPTPDI